MHRELRGHRFFGNAPVDDDAQEPVADRGDRGLELVALPIGSRVGADPSGFIVHRS